MNDIPHDITGAPVHDRGPVMHLNGGKFTYPLDVRIDEIDIQDIAASLAKLCRYTGHTLPFYSVAQHSVLVSLLVPDEDALWGLLHDAAEAYMGDISRPMKIALHDVAPGAVEKIETRIMKSIAMRFDLGWPMPDTIKPADNVMAATEKRDLLAPSTLDWGTMPVPASFTIQPLRWEVAEQAFLGRFQDLFYKKIN